VKVSNEYAVGAALLVSSGLALMLLNGTSRILGRIGLVFLVCGAVLAYISNRAYAREKRVGDEAPSSTGSSS